MADSTDEIPQGRPAGLSDPKSVSWPLVERRRSSRTPPGGVDRRTDQPAAEPVAPTLRSAALWPFRLAALVGALLRAAPDLRWRNWGVLSVATVAIVYTVWACRRPVPYRNDTKVRLRVVVELALVTAAVMLTGAWGSPFVLFFVPIGMLAGVAAGVMFSAQLASVAVAIVTVQHVREVGLRSGVQDGALWVGLLGLVAFTSGLAHTAAREAAREQQVAQDRVSRLAEANSLLFALQRVAQTLPASLNLDDVLDSTVGRLRTMVRHDMLAIYLVDPVTHRVTAARTHGSLTAGAFHLERLPTGLQQAAESHKTVRIDRLHDDGVARGAGSGLYAALRARGTLIGFIAVEAADANSFGQQQAEVVHGLTEPFGIAIDNARMFRLIRTLAADEERSRIARDLHDHMGSSLALIGFEVDRALSVAADGGELETVLRELRTHVSAVVTDVRDTLYDLRTEPTDGRDLAATVAEFLQRVEQRSGIQTHCDIRFAVRLPAPTEGELWHIAREAILNAERHSQAIHLMVSGRRTGDAITFTVRDDGIGLDSVPGRPDSYGLMGMNERAHRIGADLSVRSLDGGGTEMRLELELDGSSS